MPKLTFQKSEIEKFLSMISYISLTPDTIKFSPIMDYILLNIKNEYCTLISTSNSSYIKYMFPCGEKDCTILISYTKLSKFYSEKRRDTLIVTYSETDSKVILSDGLSSMQYSNSIEAIILNFPKQPVLRGLKFTNLSSLVIKQLNVSRKFVLPEKKDSLRPALNHSLIKGNNILASDNFISFFYNLPESFEYNAFSEKEILFINNFENVEYCKLDNWNIVKHKTIIFGNKLKENLDCGMLFEAIAKAISFLDKTKYLKIDSDQLYSFCKSIKSLAIDLTVNCYLEVQDKFVNMTYDDVLNDVHFNTKVDCISVGYEVGYKISLSWEKIQLALDGIDSKYINISEVNGTNFFGFWLENDSNFNAICTKGAIIQQNG